MITFKEYWGLRRFYHSKESMLCFENKPIILTLHNNSYLMYKRDSLGRSEGKLEITPLGKAAFLEYSRWFIPTILIVVTLIVSIIGVVIAVIKR